MAGAARGTAAIFVAKLTFMVAGYVLYAALGRMLSTEQFGVYGVVFGVVSVINMVLINGTLQTVSRFVSIHPGAERTVRRRAFVLQAIIAASLLGSYFLLAPLIARGLNDESLAPLLRLSTLIMLAYAFYAVNVGYLNGRQQFVRQASLDISFSFLKVGGIVAFVALIGGIEAVILGFALAAYLVFLLSFVLAAAKDGTQPAMITFADFTRFSVSVMGVAFLANLLLATDLFILKRQSDPAVADSLAGLYTAAQSVARIPYYLMATATLVLFPMVARLKAEEAGKREERAEVSSRGLSAVLALLAGIPALCIPIADRVVLILYPARYVDAAPALVWLLVGCCLLAVVAVGTTMLSGAGRPLAAAAVLALALGVQAAVAWWLVPAHGLRGAGIATVAAALVALVLAYALLHRWLGTWITPRVFFVTGVGVGGSLALSLLFSRWVPQSGFVVTAAFLAAGYGAYLGVLLLGGVLLGDARGARRILWVTKPLEPPLNDAGKVFPLALLRALDPDDVTVCATAAGARRDDWPKGVQRARVYSAASGFGGRLVQNLRVLAFLLLHRRRFAVLHFFFAPNPLTNLGVWAIKLISPGTRFVQTVLSRPRRWSWRRGLIFGDWVTCGSQDTAQRLASLAPSGRLRLLRPGTAVARPLQPAATRWAGPAAVSPERGARLEALGAEPGRLHLLFAGDFEHGRATAHLTELVPALFARDLPLHLHLSCRTKSPRALALARELCAGALSPYSERVTLHVDHPRFDELLELQDARSRDAGLRARPPAGGGDLRRRAARSAGRRGRRGVGRARRRLGARPDAGAAGGDAAHGGRPFRHRTGGERAARPV
jgi:stage V sporulation protein B